MSGPNVIVQAEAPQRLHSNAYTLTVRQQPERAKVFNASQTKEKGRSAYVDATQPGGTPADTHPDRKPIDPPPIVQLQITDPSDPAQNYLQSPYFFMCCTLVDDDPSRKRQRSAANQSEEAERSSESPLSGIMVSSLHRLKDTNNTDGGFFVFPDISVKSEGRFRLRFSLYEMVKEPFAGVIYIKSITSDEFEVYQHRFFPGMLESTYLSRSFSDQGVRLRVRKEPRILGKRPAQTADLPTHPSRENSSRSGSRQESSGMQSPLDQTGPFSTAYGEPSPGYDDARLNPSFNPQYPAYPSMNPRDMTSSNRASFYSQEPQPFIGYPQTFNPRQDRFQPMGNLQASGQDVVNWNEGYQQQALQRSGIPQYPTHNPTVSTPYRPNMPVQPQQGGQYHPPVPPDQQLSSSRLEGQFYERGQGQSFGQRPDEGQHGHRGAFPSQFDYGISQESYSQLPARTLPHPLQQYGGATVGPNSSPTNYQTPTSQQESPQGRGVIPGSQSGYGTQYPYGQYPGNPPYR